MLLRELTLWLGIAAIYLGFAGAFGLLLRRSKQQGQPTDRWLVWLHGGLILLPATILVLSFSAWPFIFSSVVVLLGALTAYFSFTQPSWTPVRWWQAGFGQRYFAASMALAALWALTLTWQQLSLAPALIAAASLAAGFASLSKAPQGY